MISDQELRSRELNIEGKERVDFSAGSIEGRGRIMLQSNHQWRIIFIHLSCIYEIINDRT